MKATAKQKALSSYERNYKKNYDIVCNLSQDEIDLLYLTNNSKYKRYRRCLKNIEKKRIVAFYMKKIYNQFMKTLRHNLQ